MAQRYRTVGESASVDESLFGQRTSEKVKNGTRKLVTGPLGPQSIVISQQDLARIKCEAIVKSEVELLADRERAYQVKQEKERMARERKDRMKQLEKMATMKTKLSDEEVTQMARDQAIRAAASVKIDENSDVVKVLTSMSARAAAFTMREKQVAETMHREEVEMEYDRSMDMIMEIDRLKDLQKREDDEKMKRDKRIEARKVITDQMEARQRVKYMAAEMKEQENVSMRNLMKKYEVEEKTTAAKRRAEIEQARIEVGAANDDAIRRKQESKWMEKKELEDILIYQALKDAELAKREEDEKILSRSKKERQALLLAQQEKAQNNADKLDEVRARRAAEERERRARQKDKETSAKKKAEMAELLDSRAAQAADKKEREDLSKSKQQEEFQNALRHMAVMAARESEEKERKHEAAHRHRSQLSMQIEEGDKHRVDARATKMNEGTKLRQDALREEVHYSVIRDQMVTDLENKGVNPRFLTEMRAVDVGKILRR